MKTFVRILAAFSSMLMISGALAASSASSGMMSSDPSMAAAGEKPFTDVPETHPSFIPIEHLRLSKVARGYPDGTFRPNSKLTRAEFVMLMTNPLFLRGPRTSGCIADTFETRPSTVFFPDVSVDDWFADNVCSAKVNEIIHGYPDGTFRPHRTISFVEGAKIATRVFNINVRRDEPPSSRWYNAYVQALSTVNAIPTSIKAYDQPLTRAEMAEIIYRLDKKDTLRPTRHYEDFPK